METMPSKDYAATPATKRGPPSAGSTPQNAELTASRVDLSSTGVARQGHAGPKPPGSRRHHVMVVQRAPVAQCSVRISISNQGGYPLRWEISGRTWSGEKLKSRALLPATPYKSAAPSSFTYDTRDGRSS